MRDLPIPGSPDSSSTCPSPSRVCRQRSSRSATSCSRPTSGVRPVHAAPRTGCRPRARQAPATTAPASGKPLSARGPRSSSSNPAPISRRVDAGDYDRAGLGEGLQAGGQVRRLARDLVLPGWRPRRRGRRPRPGRWRSRRAPRAARPSASSVDRSGSTAAQPGPHRPLGLVLVGARPPEVGQHAVAHELGHVAPGPRLPRPPQRPGYPRSSSRISSGSSRRRARSSRPGRRTSP